MQIPEHLACPDTLPTSFDWADGRTKRFFNCMRIWCSQLGVIGGSCQYSHFMPNEHDLRAGRVDEVKDNVVKFLNRLLGLNLQQQQIIFVCAPSQPHAPLRHS